MQLYLYSDECIEKIKKNTDSTKENIVFFPLDGYDIWHFDLRIQYDIVSFATSSIQVGFMRT